MPAGGTWSVLVGSAPDCAEDLLELVVGVVGIIETAIGLLTVVRCTIGGAPLGARIKEAPIGSLTVVVEPTVGALAVIIEPAIRALAVVVEPAIGTLTIIVEPTVGA